MSETLETRGCYFQYDPRGFVHATMKPGLVMELQDAREATDAIAIVSRGRCSPVLVDSRGIKYQSKEAREHFVSHEAYRVSSAVALLVGSPVSRVIGNFFLRHNAPSAPTKLFTDTEQAVAWLVDYVASTTTEGVTA